MGWPLGEGLGATGPNDPENEEGIFLGALRSERGDPSHSMRDAESRAPLLHLECYVGTTWEGETGGRGAQGAGVSPEPTMTSTSSLATFHGERRGSTVLWTALEESV